MPLLLDDASVSVAFGALLARLGCASAHDHPGALSASWYAVAYPGGSRLDLAILELVFWGLFALASMILRRRRSLHDGHLFVTATTTYGIFRLIVDRFASSENQLSTVSEQIGGLILCALGLVVLLSLANSSKVQSLNTTVAE